MSLNQRKVLVTGADGFIGSHLVEALVNSGARVRAFIFYNSFNSYGWLDTVSPAVLNEIEIFSGDIRDPNGVRNACRNIEVVFHLAALIGIPFSYHSPDAYVDTNIKGTLNVLQAVRDLDVAQLIHTSTSEVYGTAQFVPITEDHPLQGQSPYSATKIGADQIALSFWRSFNTPVTILRPFNTYGPRQSARAIIPTIISQIAAGRKTIEVGDPLPTRDFTFVDDTVAAFLAAFQCKESLGEVINIGSNFEVSIEQTASIIQQIMGTSLLLRRDETRIRPEKSEVQRLRADNSKAKRILGWEPQYGNSNGFSRGIEKTVDWFRNQENLIKYKADKYAI